MADAITVPTVVTRHPRTNGWDCPWHPYQLIVWTVVLLFTLSHYGFLVFYFPPYWIYLGYIAPAFVFLVHVCASIVTSTIDPADPSLRCMLQRGETTERPGFDRSQHEHVIENLHCHICDTDVGVKTKHCRLCDKCVSNFDHHCKWINNCVGSRNYKWFIVTLVSALLGVVLMAIVCLILFVTFFAARDQLRYFCNVPGNTTACDPTLRILAIAVPDPVFPTVVAVLGLLAVVGTGLIGHLTFFHFYLIFRGITTYDYIVEQRNEPPSPRCSIATTCAKKNRVTPSAMEEGILGSEQTSSEEFTSSHDSTASKNSGDSAGMVTFGRTPPHSDDEDRPLPLSEQPKTFTETIIGSVSAQNGIQLSSLRGTEVAIDSCLINTSNNNNSSEVTSTKETLSKKDGNMTQIFAEPSEGFVRGESSVQNVTTNSKNFPAFFPHALSPADANLLPGSRNTSLVLPSPDAHSSFTTSPFVHQALRANDTNIPKLQIQDEETDSQTYYTAADWQTPDKAHGIVDPSPNNVMLHRTDGHGNLLTSQCSSPVLPPFIESPVEYATLSCACSSLHEYSQPLNSISRDNSVTTVNSSSQAMIISPRPYSMKPKKVVSFSNTLVGDTKPTESLQASSPPPLPLVSDEPTLAYRNHRPLPPLSSSAPDDVSSLGSYESLHSSSSMVSLTSYNRRYSRRSQSLASSLTSLNGESTKTGKRRTRNHRADSLTKLESEWKQNRLLCPLPETKPTND